MPSPEIIGDVSTEILKEVLAGPRSFEQIRHDIGLNCQEVAPGECVALIYKRHGIRPSCIKIVRVSDWSKVQPALQIVLDTETGSLDFEPFVFLPNYLVDKDGMYAAKYRDKRIEGLLTCIEEELSRVSVHLQDSLPGLEEVAKKDKMQQRVRVFSTKGYMAFFSLHALQLKWFVLLQWKNWNNQKKDWYNRGQEIKAEGFTCSESTLAEIAKEFGLQYVSHRAGAGGPKKQKSSL